MDFSTAFLGKPLRELQYDDVINYFVDAKLETETIEFKSFHEKSSFDADLPNVIRGISAFLNSGGGLLIWGAPNGNGTGNATEKLYYGTLAPTTELKEKDTLINKISSVITPLPVGISVKILSANSQHLYIFEVQPSNYKPHQFESRYFVRLDGQTKPAPHYLVDALVKQVNYPNINGVIKFHTLQFDRHDARYSLPITVALFNFSQLQNEENLSFRILVTGAYFAKGRSIQYRGHKPGYNLQGQQLIFESFASVLHFGTPNIYEDILIVDQTTLKDTAGLVDIILSFGGKKSPAKVSSYRLNFNGSGNIKNPNNILTKIEQNLMFSEMEQHSNRSNEDTLKAFLAD